MELGLIGLGKTGVDMRERLRQAGHTVIGYDRDPGLADVGSLKELIAALTEPRAVWIIAAPGGPTRAVIEELAQLLFPGDIVIDGGDSRWADDKLHAAHLAAKDIGFVDAGVSGGVQGLENGYALTVGGLPADVAKVKPLFDALKPAGEFGYAHAGAVGAGHFAKTVHDGIEQAMTQAYAQGWELLEAAPEVTDAQEVFRSWQDGTAIRSRLLDLAISEHHSPDTSG
jgi:6-phosphogluconate dehydrogenase